MEPMLFDTIAEVVPPKRRSMQLEHCLRQFAERGLTLAEVASPKILNRGVPTLKKYCRKFGVVFPDYKPRKAIP